MRKYKLYILLLFIMASIVSTIFYFTIFGFDHFFEPKPIKIDFIEGKKKSIVFSVAKACTHEIGIQFFGRDNDHIKEIFGSFLSLDFPANIDIKITNTNINRVEFDKINFGGKVSSYMYGPNPIMLVAGRVHLNPGEYLVDININKASEDISMLEAYFRAAHNPKITCT